MAKLRMSWPNRITLARILLTCPFVIAMLYVNDEQYKPWARYGAMTLFLVMAISDGLDGWLARRNNTVSNWGAFLDPLADKLLIVCCCLLLASDKAAIPGMKLPYVVVVIIIGKDLYTILGFIIIYLVTSQIKTVPVMMGKLSTMLQLSMVLAILISPEMKAILPRFEYLVQLLWWAAAVLAVFTMIIYTRNGTRYLNEYEHQQKHN